MNPSPERNPPQAAPPRKTRRTARRRRPIQAGFWAFTREEEQGWKGGGPLQHLQGGDGVGDVDAARPAKPANGFPRPKTRPPVTHPHHTDARREAGEKRRGRGRQGKGATLRFVEEGKTSAPPPPPAVVSPPAWSRPPAIAHPRTPPAAKAPPPQIQGPPRGGSDRSLAATFTGDRTSGSGGFLRWRRGRKGEGSAARRGNPSRRPSGRRGGWEGKEGVRLQIFNFKKKNEELIESTILMLCHFFMN